jgi:chaperone BCS1
MRNDLTDKIKSNDAFEEVKAYLSTACSREARQLCAEGAADGSGFVISLRDGEEVADEYLPHVRRKEIMARGAAG